MSNRLPIIAGVILAVTLAAIVAPFASSAPDGLERVAEDLGIAAAEHPAWTMAPLPDYKTPGITNEHLTTGTAGAIGTLLVFITALGAGRLLRRTPPQD